MPYPFYREDPIEEADPISKSVVMLTMQFDAQDRSPPKTLATGTGIVAEIFEGRYHLVTAWHNLSGRHPDTGAVQHRQLALPNYVLIEGFQFHIRVPLRQGDNMPGTTPSRYLMHPSGRGIDLAILPLPDVTTCPCDFGLLLRGGVGEQIRVADMVFVVGFPLGLVNRAADRVPLPIWKIANVANDPGVDFGGPRFLIDATTLPGMSGAPVIRRFNYAGKPGYLYLGVYVGRYRIPRAHRDNDIQHFGNEPDQESSALGWVIKQNQLARVIEHNQCGGAED